MTTNVQLGKNSNGWYNKVSLILKVNTERLALEGG